MDDSEHSSRPGLSAMGAGAPGKTIRRHAFLGLAALLVQAGGYAPLASAEVFRCTGSNGNAIYTDDRRRCQNTGTKTETVDVNIRNIHSHYGRQVNEEFRNYAYRRYQMLPEYAFPIVVESELLEEDPNLTHGVAGRLQTNIQSALDRLPPASRRVFAEVKYYIYHGDKSSYGGHSGGLWYFSKGNKALPAWGNSIVLRSATYYAQSSDLLARHVILHELAHAYHDHHRGRFDRDIWTAFKNARNTGLYRNVAAAAGGRFETAYALTNPLEYFAEVSAMYFGEGTYFPYNRDGLRRYDPAGYQVVEKAWNVRSVMEQ